MQVQRPSISVHQRNARHLMPSFGEMDAPRQRGRLAPAAAGCEAALASDSIAERDAGRESVGGLPPRQLVASNQKISGEQCRNEPSVKDSARAQEVERDQAQRVLTILRLRKEHQKL